jgi:hypothetical protein
MNEYARNGLFHLPMDQSYGYSMGKRWFLAMEREIKSTVVLPIATAFCKMAQSWAQISVAHAMSVATMLREYCHDSLDFSNKASVTLGVGYLCTPNVSKQASLSIHWQRPDSIFEVEMMPSTRLAVKKELIPFAAQIGRQLLRWNPTRINPSQSHFRFPCGVQMGTIVLQLRVAMNTTPADSTRIVPSTG